MAHPQELQALSKAFSGLGVEEKTLVSILGNSHPEHRSSFRKSNRSLFVEDERAFERWDDHCVRHLKHEFVRFKNAVVMWAMHPWERDARLVKEALKKGSASYNIIVEVATTRSAEELLGARKAYHSLFDQSMEEDIASHIHGPERKLLVALVSAYRYEGAKVKEHTAKLEAETLAAAITSKGKKAIEDDEVVRILTTRSKPHLDELYKHYQVVLGGNVLKGIAETPILSETLQCLFTPSTYFSKILHASLDAEADKRVKKALTRVVVTRADHADMKTIKQEYERLYEGSLEKIIEEKANGNYRDFLLTLVTKGN